MFVSGSLHLLLFYPSKMQALSTCSSISDFGGMSQLSSELGSSLSSGKRWRRRKLCNPGGPFCNITCSSLLLVSANSKYIRSGSCCRSFYNYAGFRVLSVCPRYRIIVVRKPNGSALRKSVVLACALEQQEINSQCFEGHMKLISESAEDIDIDVKHEAKCSDVNGYFEPKEEVHVRRKEVGEEKGRRIDVRALAGTLQFAKTADDVEEILKDMGDLPLQVCSSLIKSFGMDNKLDSAIALVEWLKRKREENNGFVGPNLFTYNSLLGAVKQCRQFDKLESVLNDMYVQGIIPNVVTYNSIMAIHIEQGCASEALDVLQEIQGKGLLPSPVSYSTALLAYRRLTDGFGALRFFVELKEKSARGEIGNDNEDWEREFVKLEKLTIQICFQVMKRWLVKDVNLTTDVLKLLTETSKAGLQPVRAEYERLVWACTHEGHYVVAKELYNRIRERHSEISLSVCNHIIWLMGKAKKWWAALGVYEDMLESGPKPNNLSNELIISHFNFLLLAARKKGIWRWGIWLLDKMEEKGLKPGSREWNAVLVACSKSAEASAAVQIFKRMVDQGEKPTIVSYSALLSALEKAKLYDEAFRVWDHMTKVGVEPNLYAYTILASICVGQGKFNLVDSVIRDMLASGIEPTVVTYNAIISCCARSSLGNAAYEWFHRMKVQNIAPNEITYEMLIEALAKDGKPRLAYELYLRAQSEGLNLSSKAYESVAQSSQAYDANIDLSILGPPVTR